MFRTAVLPIVLTLAMGQNALLLCRVWCHSTEGTAAACQHQAQTTRLSLTSNEHCKDASVDAMTFLREEVRRGVAAAARGEFSVRRFAFAPPLAETRSYYEPGAQALPEARALALALRV